MLPHLEQGINPRKPGGAVQQVIRVLSSARPSVWPMAPACRPGLTRRPLCSARVPSSRTSSSAGRSPAGEGLRPLAKAAKEASEHVDALAPLAGTVSVSPQSARRGRSPGGMVLCTTSSGRALPV